MRQIYTIEPTDEQWLSVETDHDAESFVFATGEAGAALNSEQLGVLMCVIDMMQAAFSEAVELDEVDFESEDDADVGGPTFVAS